MNAVRVKVAIAAAIAVLALPASALADELMPGVTYERDVESVGGRQVVVHSVTTPRPLQGGLYELKPVLSGGTITGADTVTAMQRRLASTATVVGINGDFSSFDGGYPSGMLMLDGVLHGRPTSARSTLGIGLDGLLRIARIGFYGTWGIGDAERVALDELNRPLEPGQVGLFTPAWGDVTPARPGALDIVLGGLPATTPNVDHAATIASVAPGGGTSIPSGGAVIQATGNSASGLRALAQPGSPVVTRLILKPWWTQVQDAIGGGPALVRHGRSALPTTEGFTAYQLLPRHPRSAVGQLADGRILFLTVDGRQAASAGVTMRQLAQLLLDRGVVTGMALDGGGSSTLAFDGRVLNALTSGERPVADALMVLYYGVYAKEPSYPVSSPNGDGVADDQEIGYKLVRPATVDAKLVGPGGEVAWSDSGAREPGAYEVPPELLAGLREGAWQLTVSAVDANAAQSDATRSFSVNKTLGFLSLSTSRLEIRKRRPVRLAVGFRVAREAELDVTIENAAGQRIRTLVDGRRRRPGRVSTSWDGLGASGRRVPSGVYRVRVAAENRFGEVELVRTVVVRRR